MYVSLYTRSDNSSDNLPKLFGQEKFIAPNGSYAFTVPWDSRHMCPSYVVGYRATDGKSLGPTCCDGMINCTLSRSCHDLRFKITASRGACSQAIDNICGLRNKGGACFQKVLKASGKDRGQFFTLDGIGNDLEALFYFGALAARY